LKEGTEYICKSNWDLQEEGFVRLNKPLGTSKHKICNIWMLKELVQG